MKFLLMTLITHRRDPISGEKLSPAERLRGVVDTAVLAEELGYDGFAVGERHEDPFISSAPPVVLSHIAALPVVFDSVEDLVERSSALVGSPQQIIDKVGRYHERFGHEVIHLSADGDGVTLDQHRRSLELFQSDVAPVLRERLPSRPLVAETHAVERLSSCTSKEVLV